MPSFQLFPKQSHEVHTFLENICFGFGAAKSGTASCCLEGRPVVSLQLVFYFT